MSDTLGVICGIRIASAAGCQVMAAFGWGPPGGGGSQGARWPRRDGDAHARTLVGTPGCLPASGPRSCPWPIPWSHLRPSSPGGATVRRVLPASSACQEDLRPDSLPAGLIGRTYFTQEAPVVAENLCDAIRRDIPSPETMQPPAHCGDAVHRLPEPRSPFPAGAVVPGGPQGNPWPATDAYASDGSSGDLPDQVSEFLADRRPARFPRLSRPQCVRNRVRCQASTVAGCTKTRTSRQRAQRRASHDQKIRSQGRTWGRRIDR